MYSKVISKAKKKFNLPFKVFDLIVENRVTHYASSWAFLFLLTVVPIVCLFVVAMRIFNIDVNKLILNLPIEIREGVSYVFDIASGNVKGATIFFMITSIYSASALFSRMIKDGELIYMSDRIKSGIIRKILSILTIFILFVFFMFFSVLLVLNDKITSFLPSGKSFIILTKILLNFTVILALYLVVILINVLICPIKKSVKNILISSFISLSVIVFGTIAFSIYLRLFSKYSNLYGSLAGLVVFLLWVYISMVGLVLAPTFNKAFSTQKLSKK